jgi:hypothetical protein
MGTLPHTVWKTTPAPAGAITPRPKTHKALDIDKTPFFNYLRDKLKL